MHERHRAGTRSAPTWARCGGAAGGNPESSLVSPRGVSTRATLMSSPIPWPRERILVRRRGPMFDGVGHRLAGGVGETARHVARSERARALARGLSAGGSTAPPSSHAARIVAANVDRTRRTRPYVENLVRCRSRRAEEAPRSTRCVARPPTAGSKEARAGSSGFPCLRERGSRPALVVVRNHDEETRKQPVTPRWVAQETAVSGSAPAPRS